MDTNNINEKELDSENLKGIKAAEAQLEELTAEEVANLPVLEEMIKAGVVYGRKKSKMHPKMKPYIYTFRGGVALFDLSKTLEGLEKAAAFLKEKIVAGGKILVVATQPAAKDLAKKFAEELNQMYIVERWLGGTLTNFRTIGARIDRFKELKAGRAANKYEKYTKKERLMIDKEIERFTELFSGIEHIDKMPAAVLLINAEDHSTALREARRMKVPVVALINSDTNPEFVTYPIVGNCNARASITWILGKLMEELKNAKPMAASSAPVAAAK